MFNYKKAMQILGWLLRKCDGIAYKVLIIKLVYFADRYHLRKFGRTVSGDTYKAMNYGPVASTLLSIADQDEVWLPLPALKMASTYFESIDGRKSVKIVQDTDTDALSESDIEALEFAHSNFASIPRFELADITHRYPEWKKHEGKLASPENPSGEKMVLMDLEDFLLDAPEGENPCYELSENEKAYVLDLIRQDRELANFFRP